MRPWRHWFLDSRVGLRVLGLFVLAAGAPLVLLALLSQRAVDDALAHSDELIVAGTAKSTSLQTLERLRLAQQTLTIAAAGQGPRGPGGQPRALSAVLEMDAQGVAQVVFGDAMWLQRQRPLLAALPASQQLAVLSAPATAGGPASQAVVLRRALEDGGWRLGLVNPRFLWDGADELPPGLWQCVLQSDGTPLYCSNPDAVPLARAQFQQQAGSQRTRGLFLAADFGAADWHFVAGHGARDADPAADALRSLLPVAAAAALLLALLLSLVQLRRTMTPLQALARGAREIAARRFGLRLDIRSRDEFGDLAHAFNDMAGRLEAQFSELETLAAIDREIVDRVDLAAIAVHIVEQLQRVLPGRAVGLAYLGARDAQHLVCVAAVPGSRGTRSHRVALEPQALARLAVATEWIVLHGLLDIPGFDNADPGQAQPPMALPLRWRERCFGLIAVGAGHPIDADVHRQLLDLRNRAAIAASAAEREQVLVHAADHDSVTGLLNRHGLGAALCTAVAAAGRAERTLALLFIDLDRFKAVNDTLGHAAGDQALRQVAERLRTCLPDRAQAARPAGDEFVVLLPGAGGAEAAAALAGALCDHLAQPMLIGESLFFLRSSIGISLCTDPQTSPDTLLRSADQAMYQAKRAGGGRHALFDQQLDERARRRACIEAELPLAAERGQLRLMYQPRLDSLSGRVASVEALVRWRHPEHGDCSPGEFVPIAEETELIEHLGRWVIDSACAQLRAWRDAGLADLRVSINLSARQIGSSRLLPDLQSALARHGLRGADLELEITEGLLVEQTEATVERLHALRRLGMTLALDDFGTGYSSMSYLRNLPIDVLKIDRAFVKDLGADRSALAVARAIVALASSLGMRTVAEGVETTAQWHVLEDLRCDEVQGFLFSPPVNADEVAELVRRDTRPGPLVAAPAAAPITAAAPSWL
ncbi:MAG: EAL domain-containing protein [Piscinibacter sp.]|nr:EAL domain-containing protein [Piscinibacter sp.]